MEEGAVASAFSELSLDDAAPKVSEFPNLALYFEEVRYVVNDVLDGNWKRLLEHAAGEGDPLFIGQTISDEPVVQNELENMHAIKTKAQKCPCIVVVLRPSEEQRRLICRVQRLRFLCKGTVTVFPYPNMTAETESLFTAHKLNAEQMMILVKPYYDHVVKLEPQWQLSTMNGPQFARCAIIVMLYSAIDGDFAWHLWDAENEGGQWSFAGGDVNRVADGNLFGTAAREWDEEVPGYPLSQVIDESAEPLLMSYIAGKSARYPVQPYIYYRARQSFFEATYTEGERVHFPVQPSTVTRFSSHSELCKLHTDRSVTFLEHE